MSGHGVGAGGAHGSRPEMVADYHLRAPIGHSGALYLADAPERLGLGDRPVVVKLITGGNDAAFRRFVRELKLFSRVKSPHLVTMFDAGQHEEWFFASMEHCAGGSLLDPATPLSPVDKLEAIRDAALAAHDLHEAGIAHRDIRPGNVLHRSEHGWCLSDLDHAHLGSGSITSMAPIAAIGFLDPGTLLGEPAGRASDIYSLGAMLHWALTGRLVHPAAEGADPMLAVRAVLRHPPHVRRDDLAPDAADLVASCVAADVAQRPPTAGLVAELVNDLIAAVPSGPSEEHS